MPSLVQQVKGRLSIHVRRRSVALLEGGYASIHKGRSMDFDDLREYAAGDDVRDIDWRASARHGSMLVKRYIAERHFALLVVAPGGREMAASTPSGERKCDVAVLAAGVLGWLAVHHGDEVGLVSGAPGAIHATRSRTSEGHLERVLREVLARSSETAPPGDLPGLLHHVARHVTGRRILLVLADDGVRAREVEDVLRTLRLRHEILWITVADLDPTAVPKGSRVRDVGSGRLLPTLLEASPEVRAAFAQEDSARRAELQAMLRRVDVSTTRIGSQDEVVPAIVRLLERRRRGR